MANETEEEKPKEGLPGEPEAKPSKSNTGPIVSFREQSGTPTLHQLYALASAFHPPEGKGPLREFAREAQSLGLPMDYALATWAFVATSLVSSRTLHSILGVEQRATPAFLFAGDEIGMSRLLRDLAFEVLSQCTNCKTTNSIQLAQTKEGLELFKSYDSLNIIEGGASLDLKTWSRAPKGQIPMEVLLDGIRLDRQLKTFLRAADDVPTGVSVLAGSGLNELLSSSQEVKRLFGNFLVIPSLGLSGSQAYSKGELRPLRVQLDRLLPLAEIPDCELNFSKEASEKWKEMLSSHRASIEMRESVGSEDSAWHQRQVSTPRNWIVLALAHAIHRTYSHKRGFTGLLEAEDLEFANDNLILNHRAWDQTEDTYEKSKHVEEALWYLRLIQEDFSDRHSAEDGGICVDFRALRLKYCQHPGRDNKYTSREFQVHILSELQRRMLARPHPKISRTWVFSKEMNPLSAPTKMVTAMA